MEQDHYRTEGVEVSDVEFQNNDLILELLEGFGGVLGQIDDEVSVPKGSDTGFLGKLNDKHGSHPNLKRPPSGTPNSSSCFAVQHFAGVVAYNVSGFLEKNRDKLVENLSEVLQASSDPSSRISSPVVPSSNLLTLGHRVARRSSRLSHVSSRHS